MKNFILTVCLSAALISCGDSASKDETTTTTSASDTAASATTTTTEAPAAPVDSATAKKNWTAYATPGAEHAMMAKWNGTWTGTVVMWMAPGAPADSSKATAVNKMIYGGRYQVSTHTGKMMNMPFEGQSIMGYDNAKKVFVSSWLDNMGTGISTMEGPWDATNKTITMTGKMLDPMSGTAKEISMRHVMRVIDDNHHVYEMYCPGPDGKEFKTMEITMAKK